VELLIGYTQLVGLGHSQQRLAEFAPRVADLFGRLEQLREPDVTGVEVAVTYSAGGGVRSDC